MFIGSHQVVFQGCFENTNEGQIISRFSNELGHRLWLQGPFNHLSGQQRPKYITIILHQILEFLHV
jgi:hypothetical protein